LAAQQKNSNSVSLVDMSFSFSVKTIVSTIIAIFGFGYSISYYITKQTDKQEINELKTANAEKLQAEKDKGKDREFQIMQKRIDDLEKQLEKFPKGSKYGK